MATFEELEAQVNALTEWVNGVIAGAKNIDDLPAQSPVDTLSNMMVRVGGVTQKITLAELLIKFLEARFVVIAGLDFRVFKNPSNLDKTILETNDVMMGYDPANNFLMAKYLGGDQTDFTNEAVYESFSGF